MLHDAEVVCERTFVVEEVGAHLTDPVRVCFAEAGKDSVTGLMVCWVIKMIPVTDSDLVAGAAVLYVGYTRLAVPDTLLNNFTSVLSLIVPMGWVPWE